MFLLIKYDKTQPIKMEQVFKETIKTDYKWCTLQIKVKFFKIYKLNYTPPSNSCW